jgi:hypothetical protein
MAVRNLPYEKIVLWVYKNLCGNLSRISGSAANPRDFLKEVGILSVHFSSINLKPKVLRRWPPPPAKARSMCHHCQVEPHIVPPGGRTFKFGTDSAKTAMSPVILLPLNTDGEATIYQSMIQEPKGDPKCLASPLRNSPL